MKLLPGYEEKINSSSESVTIDSSSSNNLVTSSQNDDIQDINDLKNRAETILKNITEQIDTIPEDKQEEVSNNIKKLTENANKIIDDIKEKLEISENINVLNKTAQTLLTGLKQVLMHNNKVVVEMMETLNV